MLLLAPVSIGISPQTIPSAPSDQDPVAEPVAEPMREAIRADPPSKGDLPQLSLHSLVAHVDSLDVRLRETFQAMSSRGDCDMAQNDATVLVTAAVPQTSTLFCSLF